MNVPFARRVAVPAICTLSLCASSALAQRPPLLETPPTVAHSAPALELGRSGYRAPHDRLYLSAQPDGSPQVRGRTYKAEFTPSAATYIPFCGSEAPRSHPLSLRIESIRAGGAPVEFADSVVAGLEGTTVRYARGGVTEIYELALDSLEQKFVFDALPAGGELALRLRFATDLTASREGSALVFSSSDGSVGYGAATIVDARGASAPVTTEIDGQAIVLRAPAAFLAQATFPVTLDPVISTAYVGWTIEPVHSFAPAIAWDETNQRYCVVYEETYSATDHDVVRVFVDPSGTFQSGAYVDANLSDYWAKPDVANSNNANNFYVVAELGLPSAYARTIHGRTIDGATGALGSDTLVSTPDQIGEFINASVGGDPYDGSASNYMVVWQRVLWQDVEEHVHGRLVSTGGVLQGTSTMLIENSSTVNRFPRISKSCQQAGYYHVVWERRMPAGDGDIWAAELSWSGVLLAGPTAVVTSGDTTKPACSPIDNSGRWLLVYEYAYPSDHDIYAAMMTDLTNNTTVDVSYREYLLGSGTYLNDQRLPAADTDGVHFTCTYSEQVGALPVNYDVYASTLDILGTVPTVGESHQLLGGGQWREDSTRLCSQQAAGGSGNKLGVVWQYEGPGIGDIYFGSYGTSDFIKLCWPGWDGVMVCPCTSASAPAGHGCENSSYTGGASLNGSGNASLAADTALFTTSGEKPSAPSMVTQGTTLLNNGATFGQGVRCVGGSLKRLYVKIASGGSISAPVGSDPNIHTRSAALGDPLSAGTTRYYFVYYRDPVVLGFCPASAGYNATDTVQVTWRP